MAGKRMTSTEIWLRLMNVGDLCGDTMLGAAQNLATRDNIDETSLKNVGLTLKPGPELFVCKRS